MSGNNSGHEGQTRSGSARTSRCRRVQRRLLPVCACATSTVFMPVLLPTPAASRSCQQPFSGLAAIMITAACNGGSVPTASPPLNQPGNYPSELSARACVARRPRVMLRTFAVAQRFQCALVAQQCLARLHDEAKLGVHRVHACLLHLLRARERDTVWSARAGTRYQAAGRIGARERAFSALGASAGAGAASFLGGIFARRRKRGRFLWGKT